jgi:hypothetical protein
MIFIPSSGVLHAVVAVGPAAGVMGLLLMGLLTSTALVVVLGVERLRTPLGLHPIVALRRTPPDDRAAAA